MIACNSAQTPIEDLNLELEPLEILDLFFDCLNNIPYIKSLISKDRPTVKDLPKDSEGKIIVDVTKPHILEDTDYFRPAAIAFLTTGKYTRLRPNNNPNSEFYKWLKEEVRRCREGYVRPDGEWITGDFYFFLNYCPILLIKKDKSGKAIRTLDFPKFWEGHYYVTHYLLLARLEGKHAAELASRGKGKSYLGAALLAKRFLLGESDEVKKKVQCVVTASERKYLTGANLILDMFKYYIDFCTNNTPFPGKKLTDSMLGLLWVSGYEDLNTRTRRGSENSVIGITSKDDESKLRGSRGVLYLIEEFGTFPRLLSLFGNIRPSVEDGNSIWGLIFMYGCVCAGTKVWTLDGRYINVENLRKEDGIIGYTYSGASKDLIGTLIEPKLKECLEITLANGNILKCSVDHPILELKVITHRLKNGKRLREFREGFTPANLLKVGSRVCEARSIDIWGSDTLFNKPHEDTRVNDICEELLDIGIYSRIKTLKELPDNYLTLTKEDSVLLLSGLYDIYGSIKVNENNSRIILTQDNKKILELVLIILRKLGILSSFEKNRNNQYSLVIRGRVNINNFIENIHLLLLDKKEKLNRIARWFDENPSLKYRGYRDNIITSKVISIRNIGELTIYNLSAVSGHTYLANNIITHNTAGDNESDFSSALEIMYNPNGYRMKALNNVYDKEGLGRLKFTFFFPGYLNRDLCYDNNGNSDVTKALLEILKDRYEVKYNSSDLNVITKRIAEIPITPLEAILRSRGNMFPVTLLNERLNLLDNDPEAYTNHYIGTLVLNKNAEVEFRPTNDLPIRDFPLKDNKAKGSIEIFLMPERDKEGKVYKDRYILGHDPVDSDEALTMSLTSTFVLDLWTDKLVAEYTGRQDYADDNFEIVRLLCLFYNGRCLYEQNKKGLFAYFSRLNCLHLLADTPEYLRDKQLIKTIGYGNLSKGVNATAGINNYANERIKDWLIKPVPTTIILDLVEIETTVPNLSFLESRALLKELILFNPDINVDRVRALGMLMLYREEKMILYLGDMDRSNKTTSKSLEYDNFFSKNYDSKFSKSSLTEKYN